jgi:hypothetical protein
MEIAGFDLILIKHKYGGWNFELIMDSVHFGEIFIKWQIKMTKRSEYMD